MAILQSYYQDVYRSPVVRLSGYSGRHELASSILAYLDFGGATGTCKDGVAETMLAFATERGTLQPGMPVVEASSGSFGAALAVSCATTGHPCILVVPSSLPLSRRQHLQNLGARIVVCGSGGRRALEQVAKDTAARYNGYFTNYFANDDNPEYHRRVTGPQILKAAGDAIDAVVIGVGSGGTITGVAEYLKAWNSMIRIVAVEPSECAAISGGFIGHHSIAGIGPGFVPENYNPYVVDTVLTVSSADAERAGQQAVCTDDVADRERREILVIGASRFRVHVQRPRGAVVRPEDVGADHEVACRVEETPRLDRVRPPRGHVRIGGQGVADPDDIVVGRIQFPVGAKCDRQFGQNASPLQFERLVMTVYIHCVYSRFNALPISSFRSSMCSMPSEKRSMLG